MRKLREILRQKWVLERSHRAVAESVGVSAGAVGSVLARARAAGLGWADVEAATDEALEERIYGRRVAPTHGRPKPDPVWIHIERRKPGVTLELLHLEYLEKHPDGYRYTQFCEYYRQWLKRRGLRAAAPSRRREALRRLLGEASNDRRSEDRHGGPDPGRGA